MPDPVLRAEHLSRQVGDKRIIDDISLSLYTGDLAAIIGRSGAGKSSLLRLLNRLDEPTGGTVYLHDVDYRQIPPRELRCRVGMMLQAAYLFPGTVADNLRFGPRQRGEELDPALMDTLLEQVGLKDFAGRSVINLSGGEAQRVSLARTLANRPEVLLLDEPTASLDYQAAHEIESLLVRIVEEFHLAALIITHDNAQAQRTANRAILIDAGRLIRDGAVDEVLHAQSVLH